MRIERDAALKQVHNLPKLRIASRCPGWFLETGFVVRLFVRSTCDAGVPRAYEAATPLDAALKQVQNLPTITCPPHIRFQAHASGCGFGVWWREHLKTLNG